MQSPWSEIPIYGGGIAWEDPEVYPKGVNMLKEMIRRDRNKVSVIMWSLSNETNEVPERLKFLSDLGAEARSLDSTRLITSAMNTAHTKGNVTTLDDPLSNVLDVVGLNECTGWYGGKPEDADTMQFVLPNKPLIMSEFGAEAKYGDHGPITRRWTEEQQADVYKHQLIMFSNIPQLRGTAPWILFDFRSTTRDIPKLQDGHNRKGLFSEFGQKKQAFYVLQKAYANHTVGKPELLRSKVVNENSNKGFNNVSDNRHERVRTVGDIAGEIWMHISCGIRRVCRLYSGLSRFLIRTTRSRETFWSPHRSEVSGERIAEDRPNSAE